MSYAIVRNEKLTRAKTQGGCVHNVYTSKYFDCTYTQFTEYLADRENILLSVAEVGQILREKYILSPRTRKITRKNIKKKLLAQKEKSKSKKEIAKIQSTIVALEDSHPRQPRCIYFGEKVVFDKLKVDQKFN